MPQPDPTFVKWLPVLSMGIALAAVIVGPVIAYLVAKRQIVAQTAIAYRSVIAPMRQKWINDLRERIAEFIGEAAWIYMVHFQGPGAKAVVDVKPKALRMTVLRTQIELMLNPGEEDHQQLVKLIEAVRATAIEDLRVNEFPQSVEALSVCAKKILKTEWKVVKDERP